MKITPFSGRDRMITYIYIYMRYGGTQLSKGVVPNHGSNKALIRRSIRGTEGVRINLRVIGLMFIGQRWTKSIVNSGKRSINRDHRIIYLFW